LEDYFRFLFTLCTLSFIKSEAVTFRIYRSSSQSYPYPRTHTLLVVPPSRPIMESNVEKTHAKMRPPLNRTIPPIPESKSNDSIITHISEKRIENHVESEPSTSRTLREPSCVKCIGGLVASFTAKELQMSSQKTESDGSLVIENTMAHSLVAKTAVIISHRNRRSDDVPRSPLMSVAHSVRSKLTKLGNRFSRSDGNQNIRTSTSLSSMRRTPVDKLSYIPSNTQFKKSASMETRTSQDSIKDSTKFVSSRQILESNALKIPRIPKSHTSSNDQSSHVETTKQNVSLNRNKYSKLIRPKYLPSRPGNDTKTNSIVKAFEVHLEPKATQTVSSPDKIRQFNSPTIAFTTTDEMNASKNQDNINEATIKPTTNAFVKNNTEQDTYQLSCVKSQHSKKDHEQMKARSTSRQRSFIPLYTAPPRKLPSRKLGTETGQAPLAECESSCVENSPAVEVPPVKFTLDKIHQMCIEESSEDGATESQSLDPSLSSTDSLREACSNQSLNNESTYNCDRPTREESLKENNGRRKDGCTTTTVALPDSLINNNNLPNNPSTDCSCDNDAKSRNSPNDFVSPTAMTSSGFTTSSGFQDSPDKSPDKDAELNEQFVDMTIVQNFVLLGYLLRSVLVKCSHSVKTKIFSSNNIFSWNT
uniref:Flocculation protein FLO11-like n=1 Tax=Elaeophora elaphi TaxID=1147741 RepID=A0A0R3S609_9BILA